MLYLVLSKKKYKTIPIWRSCLVDLLNYLKRFYYYFKFYRIWLYERKDLSSVNFMVCFSIFVCRFFQPHIFFAYLILKSAQLVSALSSWQVIAFVSKFFFSCLLVDGFVDCLE